MVHSQHVHRKSHRVVSLQYFMHQCHGPDTRITRFSRECQCWYTSCCELFSFALLQHATVVGSLSGSEEVARSYETFRQKLHALPIDFHFNLPPPAPLLNGCNTVVCQSQRVSPSDTIGSNRADGECHSSDQISIHNPAAQIYHKQAGTLTERSESAFFEVVNKWNDEQCMP